MQKKKKNLSNPCISKVISNGFKEGLFQSFKLERTFKTIDLNKKKQQFLAISHFSKTCRNKRVWNSLVNKIKDLENGTLGQRLYASNSE